MSEDRYLWCGKQVHTSLVCEGRVLWCGKQVHTGLVARGGGGGLPHHKFLSSLISHPVAYEMEHSFPKRRLLNTTRRRTTKKVTHDIQKRAKARNQEFYFISILRFWIIEVPYILRQSYTLWSIFAACTFCLSTRAQTHFSFLLGLLIIVKIGHF
jgi:hypothetical protein